MQSVASDEPGTAVGTVVPVLGIILDIVVVDDRAKEIEISVARVAVIAVDSDLENRAVAVIIKSAVVFAARGVNRTEKVVLVVEFCPAELILTSTLQPSHTRPGKSPSGKAFKSSETLILAVKRQ